MTDIFLTASAADAAVTAGSGTKWKADLTAGASSTHLNKNTVTGSTAPLQMTDGATAGTDGTVVSWYTPPLKAVTVAGAVTATIWTRENATANNVAPTIRIERCSGTGSVLSTIVAETTNHGAAEMGTTAGGASDSISVTAANVVDTTLSDGDRLRITLWIDDAADQGGTGAMASGGRGEIWVNGPTGSAGQARIAFTEVLSPVGSLLAAYNFDEASGNILDVTGNGNDFAVPTGTSRTTGHTNSGIAPTTTVTVQGPSTLIGQTPQRTLMMWVKETADFTGWIWEHHDSGLDTGAWGYLGLSGNRGFRGRNGGGTTAHAAVARPTDNAWHHWAGTYDGVNVRTYLDGSLVATTALAGPIDTTIPDVHRLFTTMAAVVTVDDIRVYDTCLTASEISTLKDTPVASASNNASITATLQSATGSLAVTSSNDASASGTLHSATGSVAVTASDDASIAGTLKSATGSLAANSYWAVSMAGTLRSTTGSLAVAANDDTSIAGTLAKATGSVTATADASATVSASLKSLTAQAGVTALASSALAGTLQSLTGALVASSPPQGGDLVGTLRPVTGSLSGQSDASAAAVGSLAALVASFAADLTAGVTLSGSLSAASASFSIQVVGAPVAVDVSLAELLTDYVMFGEVDDRYTVTADATERHTLADIPDRVAVESIDGSLFTIGDEDMRKTWRQGSKDYIEFTITVEPLPGQTLTQGDVEGWNYLLAVTQSQATPASGSFVAPSATPTVVESNGKFVVSIRHLYEALTAGLNIVWVTFEPTPAKPIYQATSFTVL